MIANAYLNEWRQTVPWSDNKMVEQDLIISRLLVELFNHPKISDSLAFRGGTAIYKLFASHPVRYSEDIDLVQIKAEPIGDSMTTANSQKVIFNVQRLKNMFAQSLMRILE